ncbi:MAG: polyprenyl synthetase family protein [Acidimicrobiia bacterium]|nr:polyprenyl synthetase family protein [Acidimicrobiia bacterium]
MPVAAPPSLATIAARVDARIEDLLQTERERWAAFDPDLAGPFDEIRRMVQSGGKRLRPAFCYWGFVAAGGDGADRRVIDAGSAFEMMHAFALFHDDVMDDSASRRGAPTTHAVYADTHGRSTWAGEARRFGEGVAILVGDLAFVLSDQLLVGVPDDAWRLWNELRMELNVGQFLDILGSVQRERRIEKAERISRYKSGKYTIERPLHMGALLAAPDRQAELLPALSAYGLPLGDAFQMRDDVIGAFGDSSLTGKPVGDDLREGKPTPLLSRAVGLADDRQRQVLDVVGDDVLDGDQVEVIQQVIVETGALDALEARIEELAGQAVAALDRADITDDARRELAALAAFVVARTV